MQTTLSTNISRASLALSLALLGITTSVVVATGSAADTAADSAAPDTLNQATLKGLTAVRLTIDVSEAATKQPGLRKADLQTRLEGKLKKAGLQVLGANERAQGMPTLYLNLSLLGLEKSADRSAVEVYVYAIDLALIQEVRLLRDPAVKAASPTWRAPGSLGTVAAAELGGLRDTADELVDRFLAAHRAASGK